MESLALPFPVLPGKEQELRDFTAEVRGRLDEYTESRANAGITMERFFLMPTPQGPVVTGYLEGKDLEGAFGRIATSNLAYDKFSLERIKEFTGVDLSQPGPIPEQVLFHVDTSMPRGNGLAFSAPLVSGKTQKFKDFAAEVGRRSEEMTKSHRSIGVRTDVVFILGGTPMGDIASVYLEGPDPAEGNRKFAASREPFDVWFKKEAGDCFGLDFNQPLPPIEQVWDFQN